jgi:hypothetical protein
MEKFYYLGTGILATACSVTPLAAGVYGQVLSILPRSQVNSHEHETQDRINIGNRASATAETFRWSIGTDSFWNPFMAAGEAFAFLSIIGFFISYKVCQPPRPDCPPPDSSHVLSIVMNREQYLPYFITSSLNFTQRA